MSIKLKVRQGGASADFPDLADLPAREGIPVFDGDQPVIDLSQRWEMGSSGQGSYIYVDVQGVATYQFPPHCEVKLIEDESGNDYVLGWGRNEGGNDTGRRTPTGIGGDEVEHQSVQVMDCNIDLRGLPFRQDWERPAETTWQRLQALELRSLNGSSSTGDMHRATTDITINNFVGGNHLVDASDPVDMEAHTYPVGSTPLDVMEDIFTQWEGKRWGVTIHHQSGASHKCLLVLDPDDNTTFASALKISDQIADWDPDDPTAPVCEPIWRRGAGKVSDNTDVISGLISIWGGLDDDPRHVYVETGDPEDEAETWVDVYHDDVSENETQATRRASAILNDRRRPYITPQPTILLNPEQVTLITAGQSIEVKSVVINQGPDKHDYVAWRIAEIRWEPRIDGKWYAHLSLGRARNARFGNGGGGHAQPGSTTPKPVAVCDPADSTDLCDSGDAGWGGGSLIDDAGDLHYNAAAEAALGLPYRRMGPSAGHTDGCNDVEPGTTVTASLNIWNGNLGRSWEQNSNYWHVAYILVSAPGKPGLRADLVNELLPFESAAGPFTASVDIPDDYVDAIATLHLRYRLGGWEYTGGISSAPTADPEAECVPADQAGDTGSGYVGPHHHHTCDEIDCDLHGSDLELCTILGGDRLVGLEDASLKASGASTPGPMEHATDGDESTAWSSGVDDPAIGVADEWWAADVGQSQSVHAYRILQLGGGTPTIQNVATEVRIFGTDDASLWAGLPGSGKMPSDPAADGWTLAATYTGSLALGDSGTVEMDTTHIYRYWLFWAVSGGTADWDVHALSLFGGTSDMAAPCDEVAPHHHHSDDVEGFGDGDFLTTTAGGGDVVMLHAAAGSTETIDLADGNVHDVILTADCTFTLTSPATGRARWLTILLRQDGTGGWDANWPASVAWPNDDPPPLDPDPDAVTIVTLVTLDGGTTWFGSYMSAGTLDHGTLTGLDDDDHPQYVRTTLGGKDVLNTVAAAGATETLDLADGNVHDVTLDANCALTLTGATNGVACSVAILLRQGSGAPYTVDWSGQDISWVGGSEPDLATAEDEWNLIALLTLDGGTTWFGDAGAVSSTPSAGGGIGPLLISDTPSTPLVFADLIQNEAQDDLVYADP